MGIIKQKQIEEMEKEEERAREHKIQMVKDGADEDIFNLTNNICQGGCQNYLTVEEDGWGICFDCRIENREK